MGHLPVFLLITFIQVCLKFAFHVVWVVLRVAWRSLQRGGGEGDSKLPHTSLAYFCYCLVHRIWKGRRRGPDALHSPDRTDCSLPLVRLNLSIEN